MSRNDALIAEMSSLWLPACPCLVDFLLTASGAAGGRCLELGPFAGGLALHLLWRSEAFLATVIDDSEAVLRWVEERAAEGGYVSRLTTRRRAIDPLPEPTGAFDLVVVRGAFFFLTPSLLREVRRVLRPGGFGWVGDVFGPSTPESVAEPIAEKSHAMSRVLGGRRLSAQDAWELVAQAGLGSVARVSEAGGLWIEVRP